MKIITKAKVPEKTIIEQKTATYDFNYVSKKVALATFIEWCEDKVPFGATDITIELQETWEYDDCFTSLELAWTQEVPNPNYESDCKKYEAKLKKLEKQCQK